MKHKWKVGDRFVLINPEDTWFTDCDLGCFGVVTSLRFKKGFNDPLPDIKRKDCVYGELTSKEIGDVIENCYFRKDCIRPLTPLEELL